MLSIHIMQSESSLLTEREMVADRVIVASQEDGTMATAL